MRLFHLMFPLYALLPTLVLAGVHELWWDLTYVDDINPDGLFPRRVVGVNHTWPPPPIDVSTNDTLVVHVTNYLDEPSSLHHHGMLFNSSSWMDGAIGVSECGIPPNGGTFDYVIPVDTSGQRGTYWVHAHANGHYVDGLRAPFVLHPSTETYQYDEEFTVVLGDWYHEQHATLLEEFLSTRNPDGDEPVPDSALVYIAQNGTYLGPTSGSATAGFTSAVGFNENATIHFEPGKTYRLRVVNTSALAMFFFWIDGHEMRLIEVDGTDVEESSIDMLSLTVAQRYSVLVTARNDTSENFAIHVNMNVDMFKDGPGVPNPNITSSITYADANPVTDSGVINEYVRVQDIGLIPVEKIAYPPATRRIELEVSFATMDDGTNRGMFNQITWNSPNVPALFSELSLESNATIVDAYGPLAYVLDYQEVVDIVVKNGDDDGHPFHIHGHQFAIVGRSEDYTSNDPALNPPIIEGQTGPMRRDTVDIPSGTSATLRIIANNPGVWLLHCHMEWHFEAGLTIQLIEAPLIAQERSKVPPKIYDNCAALDTPTLGNAAGHMDPYDMTGLKVGPFPQRLGWRPKGIGAMFGSVLAAVLAMSCVVWYTMGGNISNEEMESKAIARMKRQGKRNWFGLRDGRRESEGEEEKRKI